MNRQEIEEALRRAGEERPTAPLELWEGIETRLVRQAQRPPSPWRGRLTLVLFLGLLLVLATRLTLPGLQAGKMTMLYQLFLAIGGLGLVVQAALGFAHHDSGTAHDHGDAATPFNSHDAHEAHEIHDLPLALTLLSPLRLFSLLLGVGAAGLLIQAFVHLPALVTLVLALLAGLAFYRLVILRLLRLVFQFASRPAQTLLAASGTDAIADSRFDAQGRGIVRVIVDGHLVRLLATLEGEPQPVEAGETLLVVRVDTKRNRCTVMKL